MPRKIYLASSWRNEAQPTIVNALRAAGHEVYDFRNPKPGNTGFKWEAVAREWKSWTPQQFAHLVHWHPIAQAGFKLDKDALDWCDTCVLLLPSGRSAHLEAGYAIGQGKDTIVYLVKDGFEPELMYELGNGYVFDINELIFRLKQPLPTPADLPPIGELKVWPPADEAEAEAELSRLVNKEIAPLEANRFQDRCYRWATHVHGTRATDRTERADRFLEEALELFEAVGENRERAHALVDYVFDRGKRGLIAQEVGGVLVTLASLAERWQVAMDACGNTELARIEDASTHGLIRAKGSVKPFGEDLMTWWRNRGKPAPAGFVLAADGHRCPRRDERVGMIETSDTPDTWRPSHRGSPFRTCSYCGSVHPDEFMVHVENGNTISGTDKNYKAYVMPSHDKFYFQHLSVEQRKRFVELLNKMSALRNSIYTPPFFVARRHAGA